MKNLTIKDIAKECGVSVTTVSFVLNGKVNAVSEKTRNDVLAVCKKHNYKPNYFAAALKSKTTHTVGVLIPDIENNYYSRIIKSLEVSLSVYGYSLIVSSSGYNFKNFIKNVIDISDRQIDFFIIVPPSNILHEDIKNANLTELIQTPIIVLDRKINDLEAPLVINDDEYGGYIATKHLIDKGHRTIACITGPEDVSSSNDRLIGYKKALSEANIPFDESLIYHGDYRFSSAIEASESILKNNKITAVFAFNDLMAYAVYKMANEANKIVGKDISIVGYDDNQFSTLITPSLTSVKQNIDALCSSVINKIFNKEEDKKNDVVIIKPDLVERSSVYDFNI